MKRVCVIMFSLLLMAAIATGCEHKADDTSVVPSKDFSDNHSGSNSAEPEPAMNGDE